MARKKMKKRNTIHITALPKLSLLLILAATLVTGLVSLLACFYSLIFLPCAILGFWLTYLCVKEWKRRKEKLEKTET